MVQSAYTLRTQYVTCHGERRPERRIIVRHYTRNNHLHVSRLVSDLTARRLGGGLAQRLQSTLDKLGGTKCEGGQKGAAAARQCVFDRVQLADLMFLQGCRL